MSHIKWLLYKTPGKTAVLPPAKSGVMAIYGESENPRIREIVNVKNQPDITHTVTATVGVSVS